MRRSIIFLLMIIIALMFAQTLQAQYTLGTAFNYQGQLKKNGSPPNGTCDFRFGLWDAATGGAQQRGAKEVTGVNVVNGMFAVQLDFGELKGTRWLQIEAQCDDDSGFASLSPRQPLSSTANAPNETKSSNYIQNTTEPQAGANFNIGGEGTVGTLNARNFLKVYGDTSLAGMVGVGTSKPLSNLTVQTAGENYGLLHTDGNVEVGTWVGKGSSGADSGWIGTKSNHPLRFFTANGPARMTIDLAGKVGIGTTTPGATLDVEGGREGAIFGASSNNSGIYGLTSVAHTTEYSGVLGRSTGEGGIGVIGEANRGNAWGVFGTSKEGTGVRGESAAAHTTTNPGVYGTSTGEGGIGVIGEANTGSAWGVYGKSDNGVGVYGRSASGYALYADGNAGQARDKSGLVKAMLYVTSDGKIRRCYNAIRNLSSEGCGFEIIHPDLGLYRVEFGFQVRDRFVSVTAVGPYFFPEAGVSGQPGVTGASVDRFNGLEGVDILTYYVTKGLTNSAFYIIVY